MVIFCKKVEFFSLSKNRWSFSRLEKLMSLDIIIRDNTALLLRFQYFSLENSNFPVACSTPTSIC